ncbi:MAG: hypothetical protein JRE38_11450 [Deltaproteobacteria bacterium]|nr:hypothetical protein [Deltaproteobacteria bacterium]MBW2578671.1 hypothetical protein [Deltaproteobacteria bacterium]
MTNRFAKFLCNLMVMGVSLGLAVPALAGVGPPTPTATATPTNPPATPTATATPTNPPATPTATATPTNPPATPTATATPTNPPTPVPTCADMWGVTRIVTVGKGQSPTNNPKVSHAITGNIVDPGSLKETAHRIPVCAGTEVNIAVSDETGTPTNTSDGALSCDSAGCSGVVNVTEKYKSVSSDGKDTDRMTLLPN